MPKSRLEAFSDGVIAIIITIMVLELRAPHESSVAALRPLLPSLCSYILSFVYLGIYWNNHHHMLHATKRVRGAVLWANLHLLFWLSLFPFVTDWMGENHLARIPTAAYGCILMMASIAYLILQWTIINDQGSGSLLARAGGADIKGKLSPLLYAAPSAWHSSGLRSPPPSSSRSRSSGWCLIAGLSGCLMPKPRTNRDQPNPDACSGLGAPGGTVSTTRWCSRLRKRAAPRRSHLRELSFP